MTSDLWKQLQADAARMVFYDCSQCSFMFASDTDKGELRHEDNGGHSFRLTAPAPHSSSPSSNDQATEEA